MKSVIVIRSVCALDLFVYWREVKSVVIRSVCVLERSEVCCCHQICLCTGEK